MVGHNSNVHTAVIARPANAVDMSAYFARTQLTSRADKPPHLGSEVVSAVVKFPSVRSVLWTRDSHYSDVILGWRNFIPDLIIDQRFLSALAKVTSLERQPPAAVEQRVSADALVRADCVLLSAPDASKPTNKYEVHVQIPAERSAAAGASAATALQIDAAEQPLCVSLAYRTDTGLSGGRQFDLHLSARIPAVTLHVRALSYPPSPVPTPFLHALLSGPMSSLNTDVPGCQHGACTMDAARRTVLLAADDPTALSVPVVGFWFRLTCTRHDGSSRGTAEAAHEVSARGLPTWVEEAVRHPCFRAACTWAGYTGRFGERVRMPGLSHTMLAVVLPPPGHEMAGGIGAHTVEVTTAWPRVEGGLETVPTSSSVSYAGLGPGTTLTPTGWVHVRACCYGTLLPREEGGWAVQGRTVGADVGKVGVREDGDLHWALIPGSEYMRRPLPVHTPSTESYSRERDVPTLAQTLIQRTLAHVDAHAAGTPSRIPMPRSPPANATPRVHPRETSSPSLSAWKRLGLDARGAEVRAIEAEGEGGASRWKVEVPDEHPAADDVPSRAVIADITAQLSQLTARLRGQEVVSGQGLVTHASRTPPPSPASVLPHTFRAATPSTSLGMAAAGDMRARLEAMSTALRTEQWRGHSEAQAAPHSTQAAGARLHGMLMREAASHMPGGTLEQARGLSTALRATLASDGRWGSNPSVPAPLPYTSLAFKQSQRRDNPYLNPDYVPSPATTAASLLYLPRDRGYDAASSRQEALARLLRSA